ncbi:enoyl-CoA hydratase/isomerase family protein [bacterium]|nr:enoyl-CoA hydratase/isomerase family protein [bacterium]
MISENLIEDVEGRVAYLYLNRPKVGNALNFNLVTELTDAFTRAEEDSRIKLIVLTGSGNVFCAGADLKVLNSILENSTMGNKDDSEALMRLFLTIRNLKKPVIAKVNGHAIAGGAGLACACHFIVASEEAKFGFTEAKIGFVPAQIMFFVKQRISETHLLDLFLTGKLISAKESKEINLINECVPLENLNTKVEELAELLVKNSSSTSMRLTLEMLNKISGMSQEQALQYAALVNTLSRSTEACKFGVGNFVAKKTSDWSMVNY